jgi:hypothetical protein
MVFETMGEDASRVTVVKEWVGERWVVSGKLWVVNKFFIDNSPLTIHQTKPAVLL